jgi:hypothetical protein
MAQQFAILHKPKPLIVEPELDSAFIFDKKHCTLTICKKYFTIKYCPFGDKIYIKIYRHFNYLDCGKLYKLSVDSISSKIYIGGNSCEKNEIDCNNCEYIYICVHIPEDGRDQKSIILNIDKLILLTKPYCSSVTTCNTRIATVCLPEEKECSGEHGP